MKKCPVSEYCGGCQFQGVDYKKQLEIKQEKVDKLLSSFHHVEKIIPCLNPINYRNKIQLTFGYDENHHIICGYYIPKSHMILPIEECMLCDEKINQIVSSVKKIIIRNQISIYDQRSRKGCLRHLLVRSTNTNEFMIVLVTGSFNLMKKEKLVEEIIRYNPQVISIIHNVNPDNTSSILGSRNNVLFGKGYITDELCGLKFRISAASFYQVNSYQTQVLYDAAIKALDLNINDVLIDAYCGTGTIGLSCAKSVRKVIGVELNTSAVRDAETNRKINDIDNADFICKDAGKFMETLSRNKTHIDAVIMDPPRSGSDNRFMSSMVKLHPDKIAYISCNPDTLQRDLKYLSKYYHVDKIQPVDMFPYTQHVESIALLKRVKQKSEDINRSLYMQIEIRTYTKERIKDVIQFENDLRDEENFWGWEIDDEYKRSVISSFDDESFSDSISLLAYVDNRVVGRIDTSMIKSHFDGSTKAYLDWICVIKSYRHQGVAQALLNELRRQLKERQINTLIALTASNEEAQKFYRSIPDSEMKDIGIWIAIK